MEWNEYIYNLVGGGGGGGGEGGGEGRIAMSNPLPPDLNQPLDIHQNPILNFKCKILATQQQIVYNPLNDFSELESTVQLEMSWRALCQNASHRNLQEVSTDLTWHSRWFDDSRFHF